MFEWDEIKRLANLAKHGVDFADVHLFDWTTAKERTDYRHDYGEVRVRAIGLIDSRLHVLIYVERSKQSVISLRKANLREIDEWLL